MNESEVKKSSGEFEKFNEQKLYRSLVLAGASKEQAKKIVYLVKRRVTPGCSTRKVFSLAFRLLKKESKVLASQYSLTKSIHELGPDGFLFEKYICALFKKMGYLASTNNSIEGKCVRHEVDIIAQKKSKKIYCECKFHNHPSYKNDLKTALYVQARHADIKENPLNKLSDFWLISNTKFSSDAIKYSECVGLKLLSPNYPRTKALGDLAKKFHVHPITCLTTLKKKHAKKLLSDGIILASDILRNPKSLEHINIGNFEKDNILNEIKNLLRSS